MPQSHGQQKDCGFVIRANFNVIVHYKNDFSINHFRLKNIKLYVEYIMKGKHRNLK